MTKDKLDKMQERIAAHYRHAVEKYPYFCDCILTDTDCYFEKRIAASRRNLLKLEILCGDVSADLVLECELADVYEAYARNDKAAAVDECYDCIAVLLRMVDVLEGRQKLGKPEGAEKGAER